jgi:hypothetical protein
MTGIDLLPSGFKEIWIKAILRGCIRHIGEVQTRKAVRERTT